MVSMTATTDLPSTEINKEFIAAGSLREFSGQGMCTTKGSLFFLPGQPIKPKRIESLRQFLESLKFFL
jgi:hypothetical protein